MADHASPNLPARDFDATETFYAALGFVVIPVEAKIGAVTLKTSLFPKDGTYLLPIKADVRKGANVTVDGTIDVEMTIGPVGRK